MKVIMNKVSLVEMATFVEATKELHLLTIPDIQLLVKATSRQPMRQTGLRFLQYFPKS